MQHKNFYYYSMGYVYGSIYGNASQFIGKINIPPNSRCLFGKCKSMLDSFK